MTSNQFSKVEWRIRTDLAALFRWISRLQWDDHIHSHLSARVPADTDQFLLNPLGWTFSEVTATSLILVNLEGDKLSQSDESVNVGGVTMHRRSIFVVLLAGTGLCDADRSASWRRRASHSIRRGRAPDRRARRALRCLRLVLAGGDPQPRRK